MNRIAAVVFLVFLAVALQRVWVDLQAPDDVGDGRASEIRAEEGSGADRSGETEPTAFTERRAPAAANPGLMPSEADDTTGDGVPVGTSSTRPPRQSLPAQTSTSTTTTSSSTKPPPSVTTPPTSDPTSTVSSPPTTSTTLPTSTDPDPTTSTPPTSTVPDPTTLDPDPTTLAPDPTDPTTPEPGDGAAADLD